MTKTISNLILFVFASLLQINFADAQENTSFDLEVEVNRVYEGFSVTPSELEEATSFKDLNKYYESDWVKEFKSVEIITQQNGAPVSITSEDDQLTSAVRNHMKKADLGSDIYVKVLYLPKNNLSFNDVKKMDFEFTIEPVHQASFADGNDQLMQYFKENTIDQIDNSSFQQYHLSAVKFTVNTNGAIENVKIFESSKDEKVDAILLAAVKNMPKWNPAKYIDGSSENQEFVFTIGDMSSCVVNTLGIRKLSAVD